MLLRSSPHAKLFFPPPPPLDWRRERNPTLLPLPLYPHHYRISTTTAPRATPDASSPGYRKVPLETAGAYRLIDEDTGDSVIVWGGTEEGHDLNFPSKETLFSPPRPSSFSSSSSPDVTESSSTASGDTGQPKSSAGVIGRFGKLNAHKVKTLLVRSVRNRETNSLKQERVGKFGGNSEEARTLRGRSIKNIDPKSLEQKAVGKSSMNNEDAKDFLVKRNAKNIDPMFSEKERVGKSGANSERPKTLLIKNLKNREPNSSEQEIVGKSGVIGVEATTSLAGSVKSIDPKSLEQKAVGKSSVKDEEAKAFLVRRNTKNIDPMYSEKETVGKSGANSGRAKSLLVKTLKNREPKYSEQEIVGKSGVNGVEDTTSLVRSVKNTEPKFSERETGRKSGVNRVKFDTNSFDDVDEDYDSEEEDDIGSSWVHEDSNSSSNFLKTLHQGEEEVREGSLPIKDSDWGSPSSRSSSYSHPPGKGGWGVVDTRDTDRFEQRRRKDFGSDGGFFSKRSFKELGCTDDILEALRKQQFMRPSHIQAMCYAHILGGKTCIIADQSGSGKTLAYLTPIIQCLRQEEILGKAKSMPKNPRVIILVPTAELASQVLSNCRSMAKHGVPFRSIIATGGFRQKTQFESLQQELDVLIATPGRFIYLLKEGFLELANLRSVVLDEVDILFNDEGFEEVLTNLITCAPVVTQYLFVTATLPVDIYNKLVEVFPDCEVVMGPAMHRTSSGLEEILVDCSGDDEERSPDTAFLNKKSALLRLIDESPVKKTIVFCNKIDTCRKVENALKRHDRKGTQIKVLPFHSALEQQLRLSNLKEFLTSETSDRLFLVCTDRASRGIDFKAVDHVLLFDFPRDPSEYVRRVGRAARGVGGKGKAFVFVVGKQVSLAKKVLDRNQKGRPLHDVPC